MGGLGEFGIVSKVKKDGGGGEGIASESAEGDAWPGAILLLQFGEVAEGVVDGQAVAVAAGEGADAEGGGQGVGPAAVGLLGRQKGADHAGGEGRVGLAEFIETD